MKLISSFGDIPNKNLTYPEVPSSVTLALNFAVILDFLKVLL